MNMLFVVYDDRCGLCTQLKSELGRPTLDLSCLCNCFGGRVERRLASDFPSCRAGSWR